MLEELRADLILVVEDVRETSDGIERLLKADGYRVALARVRGLLARLLDESSWGRAEFAT